MHIKIKYRHIGAEEQPGDLSASTYRVHFSSPRFHTQHSLLPSFTARYKVSGLFLNLLSPFCSIG